MGGAKKPPPCPSGLTFRLSPPRQEALEREQISPTRLASRRSQSRQTGTQLGTGTRLPFVAVQEAQPYTASEETKETKKSKKTKKTKKTKKAKKPKKMKKPKKRRIEELACILHKPVRA